MSNGQQRCSKESGKHKLSHNLDLKNVQIQIMNTNDYWMKTNIGQMCLVNKVKWSMNAFNNKEKRHMKLEKTWQKLVKNWAKWMWKSIKHCRTLNNKISLAKTSVSRSTVLEHRSQNAKIGENRWKMHSKLIKVVK